MLLLAERLDDTIVQNVCTSDRTVDVLYGYHLDRKIGEGSYGEVYCASPARAEHQQAFLQSSGVVKLKDHDGSQKRCSMVLKVVQFRKNKSGDTRMRAGEIENFRMEVAIAKHAAAYDVGPKVLAAFLCAGNEQGVVVMERWDGDLEDFPYDDYVPKNSPKRTKLKLQLFYLVKQKLDRLHYELGIVHNDCYPRNILYRIDPNTNRLSVAIHDFGWAVPLGVKHIPRHIAEVDTVSFLFGKFYERRDDDPDAVPADGALDAGLFSRFSDEDHALYGDKHDSEWIEILRDAGLIFNNTFVDVDIIYAARAAVNGVFGTEFLLYCHREKIPCEYYDTIGECFIPKKEALRIRKDKNTRTDHIVRLARLREADDPDNLYRHDLLYPGEHYGEEKSLDYALKLVNLMPKSALAKYDLDRLPFVSLVESSRDKNRLRVEAYARADNLGLSKKKG